jgi:predicted TIM-barrel enzyme
MVHIPALPGSPDYDAASGMTKIITSVIADLEATDTLDKLNLSL